MAERPSGSQSQRVRSHILLIDSMTDLISDLIMTADACTFPFVRAKQVRGKPTGIPVPIRCPLTAVDAGAPTTAAYGADGHSHQHASSAEGSESLGGRSGANGCFNIQAITVDRKGLNNTS